MECWRTEQEFRELLAADPLVQSNLTATDLDGLFDLGYFLKHVGAAFERLGLDGHSSIEVNHS